MITYVDGDGFRRASAQLCEIADRCEEVANRCASEAWFPDAAMGTIFAGQVALVAAQACFIADGARLASAGIALIGDHLVLAHEWYSAADAAAQDLAVSLLDDLTAAVVLVGAATIVANPVIAISAAVTLAALAGRSELLATPFGNTLLRAVVSGSDEIAMGVIGAAAVGLAATPFGPLAAGASTALAATVRDPRTLIRGAVGVMGHDGRPVTTTLQRIPIADTVPPATLAEVVHSIPKGAPGEVSAQVRVRTYVAADGAPIHLISIDGTRDPGFGSSDEVNDNLSNLEEYGSVSGEQYEAIVAALDEAGVQAGDAVVLTGYSQGAIVAANLANSGRYDVRSAVVTGAPVHANGFANGAPVVQLEHSGDVITAAQGYGQAPQENVLIARRDPFAGETPPEILAPHAFSEYEETARLVDADASEVAQAQVADVLAPLNGATLESEVEITLRR